MAALIIGSLLFVAIRKLPLSFLWWLPIIVGVLLYYMANAIRNTQRNINEYTLEWDGDTIRQNTPGMPQLVLRVAEISNVEITAQGLEISTSKHHNVLTIPSSLSGADIAELKDGLTKHLGLPKS